MHFEDGASPPADILATWIQLVENVFYSSGSTPGECIAVHCVAGLGRCGFILLLNS